MTFNVPEHVRRQSRMGMPKFVCKAIRYNVRRLFGMTRQFPELKGMSYRQYLQSYLPHLLPERLAK